jgi:hypothetical protein
VVGYNVFFITKKKYDACAMQVLGRKKKGGDTCKKLTNKKIKNNSGGS